MFPVHRHAGEVIIQQGKKDLGIPISVCLCVCVCTCVCVCICVHAYMRACWGYTVSCVWICMHTQKCANMHTLLTIPRMAYLEHVAVVINAHRHDMQCLKHMQACMSTMQILRQIYNISTMNTCTHFEIISWPCVASEPTAYVNTSNSMHWYAICQNYRYCLLSKTTKWPVHIVGSFGDRSADY